MMCFRHSCVWPIFLIRRFRSIYDSMFKLAFYLFFHSVELSDCLGPLGLVFLQYIWRSRKDANRIIFGEQDDQLFIASVELLNLDRDADN